MKICFLLQRRFAFIGHNLAILLKEKYGVTDFCGYVYLRSSYNFLKEQKEINYTSLLLDDEIHKQYKKETLDLKYLEYLEKTYGIPNLWPYLRVDRVLMSNQLVREYPYDQSLYSHEELLKILQVQAKTIIKFLEKEKPNCIFFTQAIGGVGSLLLYHIAKKMGITILCATLNTLPRTVALGSDYMYLDKVEEKFQALIRSPQQISSHIFYEQAKQFLIEFNNRPQPYSQIHGQKKNQTKRGTIDLVIYKNLFNSFHWFIHLLYEYFTQEIRYDYSYTNPIYYLIDRFKRKFRSLFPFKYDNFEITDNYIFFPLQLEPEVSLLLLAPWVNDQQYIIKQIAKSLPVGYILYVKEHPQMKSYRPASYYKKLKKMHNVKIVDPGISSFEVIKHAKLITTITGTVGWEAILLKKPVITFGDIFYNKIPMVKNCKNMEKLPWLIKEQLEKFKFNEQEILTYICALLEESAQNIDLLQLWEQETDENKKKENLQPLVDLLAKRLNLSHK